MMSRALFIRGPTSLVPRLLSTTNSWIHCSSVDYEWNSCSSKSRSSVASSKITCERRSLGHIDLIQRKFSSSPIGGSGGVDDAFIDERTKELIKKRHSGIVMNSKGFSHLILPGEYVIKTNQKTGSKKKVFAERSLGYFWMLKDLKETDNKPIVSNDKLIPTEVSKVFPELGGADTLTNLHGTEISLPEFFTNTNRSMDATAQCTLVTINFNDFGYKMLPSWIDPFEKEFSKDKNRAQIVRISMHEGRILSFLRTFIISALQKSVPEDQKAFTCAYFGDCETFRDTLRMHNNKTAYVYLLDGLGRVRFAGSGLASEEESQKLIDFAKDLTPALTKVPMTFTSKQSPKSSAPRVGRKIRR